MRLDLWTLILVTVFVTALLGGLLLFSWRQNRRIEALFWWGAGFLFAASGAALLVTRGNGPVVLSIVSANAALFGSYGLMWAGCRSFAGDKPRKSVVWAGCLVWFAFCSVPALFGSFGLRVLLASTLATAYTLACAVEIRRLSPEKLASSRPIVAVLLLHAAAMASRPPLVWFFDANRETTVFTFPWITAHAFETLVATVLLAFLFLALAKERVEQEQRNMASRDPLTGSLNRRAFVEQAERLLGAAQPNPGAVLLVLDIDRFKRVNDVYGHATGDAALERVAAVAAESLPPGALFARLGGEEFGCLLPGTAPVDGYYTAEYLRNALALRPLQIGTARLTVTTSIGLATSAECGHDLQALMSRADAALYEAKRSGRNRVVCGRVQLAQAA